LSDTSTARAELPKIIIGIKAHSSLADPATAHLNA
jgi:hypothetical protein